MMHILIRFGLFLRIAFTARLQAQADDPAPCAATSATALTSVTNQGGRSDYGRTLSDLLDRLIAQRSRP